MMSAPDRSSLVMTNSSKSTSSARLILPVWIWKMRRFVVKSGMGNSILRSMRPGRRRAGSSVSILLVANSTLTSPRESNPSSCGATNNAQRANASRRADRHTPARRQTSASVRATHLTCAARIIAPRRGRRSKPRHRATHGEHGEWRQTVARGDSGTWLSSSSIVRWISRSPPDVESYRLVPTASISSMKTIDGACPRSAPRQSRQPSCRKRCRAHA